MRERITDTEQRFEMLDKKTRRLQIFSVCVFCFFVSPLHVLADAAQADSCGAIVAEAVEIAVAEATKGMYTQEENKAAIEMGIYRLFSELSGESEKYIDHDTLFADLEYLEKALGLDVLTRFVGQGYILVSGEEEEQILKNIGVEEFP